MSLVIDVFEAFNVLFPDLPQCKNFDVQSNPRMSHMKAMQTLASFTNNVVPSKSIFPGVAVVYRREYENKLVHSDYFCDYGFVFFLQ